MILKALAVTAMTRVQTKIWRGAMVNDEVEVFVALAVGGAGK